jgi:hypothetical protein
MLITSGREAGSPSKESHKPGLSHHLMISSKLLVSWLQAQVDEPLAADALQGSETKGYPSRATPESKLIHTQLKDPLLS